MGWAVSRYKVRSDFSPMMPSNPRLSPTNGPKRAMKVRNDGMELPLVVNSRRYR